MKYVIIDKQDPRYVQILHGDAEYDDTMALNELVRGHPMVWPNGFRVQRIVSDAVFTISGPLIIPDTCDTSFVNNVFVMTKEIDGPVIQCEGRHSLMFNDNKILMDIKD